MVKSIILRLDEVSMIGYVLFNTIHLRLDDIFPQNSASSFGGHAFVAIELFSICRNQNDIDY
jgi:hypothetical protein